MNLSDYEPTAAPVDFTPRPRASQSVAAVKRATQHEAPEPPVTAPKRPQQLIVGVVGMLSVIGVLALALSQHGAPARPLQLEPASAPAQAFEMAPTAAPAPTSAPIAPTAVILPTTLPQPAQTGRGLTIDLAEATPTDPPAPEPTAAPAVELVVSGENDQHLTVIGRDACNVAIGARRCGK